MKKIILYCSAVVILAVIYIISINTVGKNEPAPGYSDPKTRVEISQSPLENRDRDVTEIAKDTQADDGKPLDASDAPSRHEAILLGIHQASIQYEPEQIQNIAPYLVHPEPEVRLAAVDGLIVLGERSAADHLREAAKQMNDPREAVTFLDAADYLELPSFRFNRKQE